MAEKSKSWTKALFVGLWTALNFCRKLFFNVVFLVIVIGIIAIAGREESVPQVTPGSALMLSLKGALVVQKTAVDPFSEFLEEALEEEPDNPEVLVRDVVKVLENAKEDNRIKAVVLNLQGLQGGGLDKLRTIAEAIDDFKTSEKPVIAVGDYYSQSQYYLAAHADKIYLNPIGGVSIEGYANYGMYLKRALEKLKVNMHIFRVGTFKSAVEPYIREDMSDAAKEMNKRWLDQYWLQYKQDVAAARGVDITNFDESLDVMLENFEKAGGNSAQYAIQKGWVDAVKTREEVRQELIALVGKDDNPAGFKLTNYRAYNKVINPPMPAITPLGDKVAIVVAKGTILDGDQQAGNIGGNSTAALLRQARLDDSVKAVVLQVDSPGGSAAASEIIRQEILNLREAGKPVIASMTTYAASGGYWISASADKIFASPSTITGSIGVFAALATFENTADYLGVDTDGVATTDIAGFSTLRGIDPMYSQLIQRSIESKYQEFLTLVASERNMDINSVDNIAQGRVWIGTDALDIGLVDELGTLDDAVAAAAEMAGTENYNTVYVTRKLSSKELFWKEFFGQALVYAIKLNVIDNNSMLTNLMREAKVQADLLSSMNDPQNMYTLCLSCRVVDNR
ncbi:signal peptide peptidase SppA [Alteromonas lipolytica]|uniref:Signal peptide peptidase SppA n=1 Tax=Alteromonas lipolytica TaxID=1856405 RepID=A0A1E8FGX7_9ALTE|nr:signal peptide peptidase SppA [Alteromonas lipolytica]OFI34996.1 signal peptide peptidase SppA [Alteromonas lipolytica]GGF55720.1 protease [Alteromonas lipolytica]